MTALLRREGVDAVAYDYREGVPAPTVEPLERFPEIGWSLFGLAAAFHRNVRLHPFHAVRFASARVNRRMNHARPDGVHPDPLVGHFPGETDRERFERAL